jgi:hypothetical protein
MINRKTCAGIDKDPKGVMHPTGNIIRDARDPKADFNDD